MKKIFALVLAATMLTGCSSQETTTEETEVYVTTPVAQTLSTTVSDVPLIELLSSDQFTGNDYETGLVFDSATTITLSDSGSTASGTGVTIDGSTVTITQEGSYTISGSLSDGQLVVAVDDSDKVQLIFSGVSISNTTTAAVDVQSADKVFVTLQGTNTLTATIAENEDSSVDAALFSKSDLSLNGTGSLTVTATNGHGITTKDDLAITSGTYTVTADGHGLEANNSIRIASGTFTLDTGKDGLHAEHDEDTEKGYIYIVDGTFVITALGDGLDSSSQIQVDGGDFTLTTGGGSALNTYSGSSMMSGRTTTTVTEIPEMTERTDMTDRADMTTELPEMTDRADMMEDQMQSGMMDSQMQGQMGQSQMSGQMSGMAGGVSTATTGGTITLLAGGGGGQMQSGMMGGMDSQMQSGMTMPGMTESTTSASDTDDTLSTKGMKASYNIVINAGDFTFDTFDDAIHSNGNTYVYGGTFTIATGDDAIHSDWNTVVADGNITITTCYEGLEGQQIDVLGGTIDIYALDDGINAARSDNPNDGDIYIHIAGGTIDMDTYNEGDGVDSNGAMIMTGGTVRISGTTITTDTPLDYSGEGYITGGTFISAGSVSQTSQNFGSNSTQGSIWISLASSQTGTFTLTDSAGNVVVEYTPTKAYQTVTISTPDIVDGETYTLVAGTETFTIEMDGLIYGEGNEHSMGGNTMGGMTGRR